LRRGPVLTQYEKILKVIFFITVGWNKKFFDLYKMVEIANEKPLLFEVVS